MFNKNNSLPPLDYLLAFDAAADLGSFSKASKTLNISESAISRKVKLLEHHFKKSFFWRRERSIELTAQGEQFHRDIAPVLEELRTISDTLQTESQTRSITLAATNSVAGLWLMPRLPLFNDLHKELKITLVSSDNDNECLGQDVDLTILRGDGHWPGYHANLLFGETIYPVCSPLYFEKNPSIADVKAFANHSLIGVASRHAEWMNWSTWLRKMLNKTAQVDHAVLLNTYPLSIEAAVSGLGIALGWGHLLDHLIEEGKLVRPLEQASVRTEFGYYLLKKEHAIGIKERDCVENWLLEISANRRRYENDQTNTSNNLVTTK